MGGPEKDQLEARRLRIAQPAGSAAAASRIFTISPMINGATPILNVTNGELRRRRVSHAQPASRITTDPIVIAAAAVRKRLSQPCSANAPVMYAAAGNARR